MLRAALLIKSRIRNVYIKSRLLEPLGLKKRGLFELTKLKKGALGVGGGTYPYCLTMGVPPPGL